MEKINIAELLKDCPTGMELDCTMYENVSFGGLSKNESDEYPITVDIIDDNHDKHNMYLTKEGCWSRHLHAKCVIFPKGKTTWEGFVPPSKFKDGDVLFVDCSDDEDKGYQYIFILNKQELYGKWHSYCHLDGVGYFHSKETYLTDDEYNPRFATEEEKQKLFQAIKDNGYKWNEETKTLEKLLRFKIGDKIRHKTHIRQGNVVTEIKDTHYILDDELALPFISQDEYELVSNQLVKPQFKVGDRIILKDNPHNIPSIRIKAVTKSQYILENEGFFYIDSANEKYVLEEKFNINTLVPFESRVLIRNDEGQYWIPAFWGCKRADGYTTTFGWCKYCIPYEGNEHLLGTNDDCDEYFKTWK